MPTPRASLPPLPACGMPPAWTVRGLTIVELLAVVLILLILIALALPVVGVLRTRVHIAQSRETVCELWLAVQEYADDHPWHLYPTPQVDRFLANDPTRSAAVLTQLLAAGFSVPSQVIDRNAGSPWLGCLCDPWHRPYRYVVDAPRLAADGTIDSSSMNGVADRPAPLPGWNPRSSEPFAYLWSVGPVHGTFSQDADASNAASWIYAAGVR